jgi:hypothetical protein
MLDLVQLGQPAPRTRRLLLRLCLLTFCGGLLLLLSSRPAVAAERREPQLLDPVAKGLCGPVDGRDHGLAAAFAGFGDVAADLLFLADRSGPSGRRRSQFARRPVHPVPAGPDRRGEPSRLPGVGLAALTAAPVLVGLMGRGRARPDRSGGIGLTGASAGTGSTGASAGTDDSLLMVTGR